MTRIWLEGGGGGNCFESYDLAWMFGAHMTRTDAWEKRRQKGFLFTVGDEEFPQQTAGRYVQAVLKDVVGTQLSPASLLQAAQERYHVYHIVVLEGHHARRFEKRVVNSWQEYLGDHVLPLVDHRHVAEVIVSAIEVATGRSLQEVAGSWDADVAETVRRALLGT